jgi:hypothetical protein
MRKIDKSLREVWKWKEKVFEDYKGLPPEEYARKIKANADRTLSGNKIKLKEIALEGRQRKIA